VLGTSFLFDAVPDNEPTRHMLDDLFPDKPVFIDSFDLHCGWVNTAALELMEITDDTADPIGGEIRRDADGRATGYLLETALHDHMWRLLARVDEPTRDRHLAVAMRASTSPAPPPRSTWRSTATTPARSPAPSSTAR